VPQQLSISNDRTVTITFHNCSWVQKHHRKSKRN